MAVLARSHQRRHSSSRRPIYVRAAVEDQRRRADVTRPARHPQRRRAIEILMVDVDDALVEKPPHVVEVVLFVRVMPPGDAQRGL